ncbi:MAG: hypothetical protein JWO38_6058 [Gemmataceae bacterium]|nr:hypothetical protein [Gemmataceae bacterium]
MAQPHPKRLLVEGDEDKRIIPEFMEHFIPWGNTRQTWPVEIMPHDGIEDLLHPGNIGVELKSPGLQALGVIVDGNSDPKERWRRIRERAEGEMPLIPADLPPTGLIYQHPDGRRFGVWLMPDNVSPGMIETFLSLFVKDPTKGLWPFVQAHCKDAKTHHNAPYKDVHLDKAQIHSWLAIQEPPGCQLHVAVLAKVLQPTSPHADAFVKWFRDLFQL